MHNYFLIDIFFVIFFFYSLKLFKSKYLKLILIIFAYPIFSMMFVSYGMNPGRIVNTGMELYDPILIESKYLGFLAYCTFVFALFSVRNFQIEIQMYEGSKFFRIAVVLILIFCAVLAYPSVYHLSSSRFGFIKVFNPQVLFICFSVIALVIHNKKWSITKIVFSSILLMNILGGERVESVITLLLVLLSSEYTFLQRKTELNKKDKLNYGLLGVLFVLAIIGGAIRQKIPLFYSLEVFVQTIVSNVVFQSTAVDVIHVFYSGVYFFKLHGPQPYLLLNDLYSFIPMSDLGGPHSAYSYTKLCSLEINNVGGGLFFTAGYMAYGVIGMVAYTFLFGLLFANLISRKNEYGRLISLLFLVLIIRMLWYGLMYVCTPVLFLSILYFCFFVLKLFNHRSQ